ncbi:hypothetical protein LU298_13505 [Komagataeibacter intermedius]|uniref:Uncharacterized protein n=3 Tax=Komagataeibacter intermedius TaxID=66229 RepID=A0A0N0MDX1_9PROT|nr:hypothetical protein [Komagataeibacter intermedius]KPH85786.1 hypothetical protein GLUCOINTEAF2_0201041 [Komagataeibacter intermedius AF2]MCF3637506.1 hypothetical protein [Komagataeibacter intermedius]
MATQNYILYRTAAFMYQPGYAYIAGETPVIPAAVISAPLGTVIATQLLSSLTGVTAPDGFAYALDAEGAYPPGSIYTPATGYTLSGASTGTAGTALTLTLTPDNDGPGAPTTVTLSDGNAGGAFSADTVTFNGCTNTARTVTYTPKAAGTITISATNDGGLSNPTSLNVVVAAATA